MDSCVSQPVSASQLWLQPQPDSQSASKLPSSAKSHQPGMNQPIIQLINPETINQSIEQ
jgi:hypothetical protein